MPIVRVASKLVYFAHVPKCAGSAVSNYMAKRFGPVAFLDENYEGIDDPWSKTSPQHITAREFYRLFPVEFFDELFCVVRHPVSRLISEHGYLQRNNRVSKSQRFSDWIITLPNLYGRDQRIFDNHLQPMSEIVPVGATVFRLEDGLDRVVAFLDGVAGDTNGPRSIEPVQQADPGSCRVTVSPRDIDLIERMYAADYVRFGYKMQSSHQGVESPGVVGQVLRSFNRKVMRRLKRVFVR